MTEPETVAANAVTPAIVDLFFTPYEVAEEKLKPYNVVVVDVLRSATTIATALINGARYVIPAPSIAEATALAAQLDRESVLLCGEREGRLIEGFHIGNSPADYTRERVRARHIIFGSTNGSPAVVKAASARNVFLCGFVNLNPIIDALASLEDLFPLTVLCAGKLSRYAIEDSVCGGSLILRLQERLGRELTLNDAARTAILTAREFGGDLEAMLRASDHGRYLIEIGMESDLPLCASDSTLNVVPILRDDKLVKFTDGNGTEKPK
jgi:2-phosphosulfolactate phosphatase